MKIADTFRLAWSSLASQPGRSALIALAMSIGVGAVVVLTALGEGAKGYVLDQFAGLGTHLVIVLPGRAETTGSTPGVLSGQSTRDLTLEDAEAVRHLRGVVRVAPLNIGVAQINRGSLSREVVVLGSNADLLDIRHMKLSQGRFLPVGPMDRATPVCVLGEQVRAELFGASGGLNDWVRLGDRRFRVVGILGGQGQQMGFNTDESVVVPVAAAQQLFNTASLFRILVEAEGRAAVEPVKAALTATLKTRHENKEDVTVLTQDAILATFDKILTALTLAVAGIAGISLGVAGILIMNVMLVSVTQRRHEIGLLKALGAPSATVRHLFLAEAALMATMGAIGGLLLGQLASAGLRGLYPDLPAAAPVWAMLAAVGTAVGAGLLFAWLPARRAARMEAAQALARR
jgi:putative ABC transport system permease protein